MYFYIQGIPELHGGIKLDQTYLSSKVDNKGATGCQS